MAAVLAFVIGTYLALATILVGFWAVALPSFGGGDVFGVITSVIVAFGFAGAVFTGAVSPEGSRRAEGAPGRLDE